MCGPGGASSALLDRYNGPHAFSARLRAPTVCDEWMPFLQLPLTPAQFLQLPRHAAYRYDYDDGQAWLNPRPRYYHALLELGSAALDSPAEVSLRLVEPGDWEALVEVFAEAFR